ncbi:hypothetical protein FQS87_02155 [Enterococcus avium]|nr:hypothetical protein [Enterococcus avium]
MTYNSLITVKNGCDRWGQLHEISTYFSKKLFLEHTSKYRLFRKRSCDKSFVTAPLPYLKLIAGCQGIFQYFICDIFINDQD